MKWLRTHPDADVLSGYANRTLDEGDQRSIAEHLESCEPCRDSVMILRQLTVSEGGALPPRVLDKVLEGRTTGRRVILPVDDSADPGGRRLSLWTRGAIAAGSIAAALLLLLQPHQVTAGERAGLLRFDPPRPLVGATLTATYAPGALLNRYDSLTLRARLRRPTDPQYNRGPLQGVVAVLHRGAGGAFRATFRLPDSIVFAAFAVESPAGDVVDDNGGRLWELVAYDQSGKPLFDGLVQKIGDLMGRNWEQTLITARQLTGSYPDEPEGWSLLVAHERWVLGDSTADALLPTHQRRLASFQNRFAEQDALPLRTVAGMEDYAIQVDDHASARYWSDRHARQFPDDPFVLFRRENRLRNDSGWVVNPHRYFATVDSLWVRITPGGPRMAILLAINGLGAAVQTGDTNALRVWSRHYEQVERDKELAARSVGTILARFAPLRPEGLDGLRRAARLLNDAPDAYRPLGTTEPAHRAASAALEQRVLSDLADALLLAGDTAAALDTLRVASTKGWNSGVFRSIAGMWLANGDTIQALQNYARVIADPIARIQLADSLDALEQRAPKGAWKRWVDAARSDMRRAVLAGTVPYLPAGAPRVQARDGSLKSWADLTRGHVTVVAFWSRKCGYAVRALPELARLTDRLRSIGVTLVTIADEPMSDTLRAFLRGKHLNGLPAYGDARDDARRAFANFATPEYYVLDSSGRVVFSRSQLADLSLQAAALLPDAR